MKQISNGFRFGANFFLLDEMETEEKNRCYRENFANAFNYATLGMYWNNLEPTRGKGRSKLWTDWSKRVEDGTLDECLREY